MNSSWNEGQVWDLLRGIPDPEFGIDIVDLGLVYSVQRCEQGTLQVVMTLTTPSCPSGGWIYQGAKEALGRLVGPENLRLEIVFEPPWSPEMLSESARRALGRAS